jgi:hypothetical protein
MVNTMPTPRGLRTAVKHKDEEQVISGNVFTAMMMMMIGRWEPPRDRDDCGEAKGEGRGTYDERERPGRV